MKRNGSAYAPSEYTGINKKLKIDLLQHFLDRRQEGTFREFFDDWKWIFSFSKNTNGLLYFIPFWDFSVQRSPSAPRGSARPLSILS